jgi:hypothetical protein
VALACALFLRASQEKSTGVGPWPILPIASQMIPSDHTLKASANTGVTIILRFGFTPRYYHRGWQTEGR